MSNNLMMRVELRESVDITAFHLHIYWIIKEAFYSQTTHMVIIIKTGMKMAPLKSKLQVYIPYTSPLCVYILTCNHFS